MENRHITQKRLAQLQENSGFLDIYIGTHGEEHSVIDGETLIQDIELTHALHKLAEINKERIELIKLLTR